MTENMELVADEKQLLAVDTAMTNLQAEKFIKPKLQVFGKSVVEIVEEYPQLAYKPPPSRRRPRGTVAIYRSWKAMFAEGETAAYKRTGHLGRSWRRSTRGLKEEVKNLADYAGWVHGRKQPYTWRYGWQRLRKVMHKQMDHWIDWMVHKAFQLWERKT